MKSLMMIGLMISLPVLADTETAYQLQATLELPKNSIPSHWNCDGKAKATVLSNERDYAYNPYVKETSTPENGQSFSRSPYREITVQASEQSLQGISVTFTEDCYYSTTEVRYVTDSDGNLTTQFYTEGHYGEVNWLCRVEVKPLRRQGDKVPLKCAAPVVHDFEGDNRAVKKNVAFTQPKGSLQRHSTKLKITHDLCQGVNLANRKIIHLDQGIKGRKGEDDFEYTVVLDDKKTLKIPSKDGSIKADIAYCGGGEKVKVDVTAKELDLFFDDNYVTSRFAKEVRLGDGDEKRMIRLIRKAGKYFGWVSVSVIDAPAGDQFIGRFAERPTHE